MSNFQSRPEPITVALLSLGSLFALLHLAWLTLPNTGRSSYALGDNLLTLTVSACCTSLCLYVAWRDPAQRRLWLCWGLGLLFFMIGDALWFYIQVGLRLDPFPSLADVFFLLQAPMFAIGILNLPRSRFRPTEAARIALNIAVITAALATVTWRFAIAPTIDGGGETLAFVISLLYPLANFMVLSLLMFYLLRPHSTPLRGEIWLLCAGVLLFSSADLTFTFRSAENIEDLAGPYYAIWSFAKVCIAGAAFFSLRHPPAAKENPVQPLETKDSSIAMLYFGCRHHPVR